MFDLQTATGQPNVWDLEPGVQVPLAGGSLEVVAVSG